MNLDVFSGYNPFKKETRIAQPLIVGDKVSDIYFTIPLEDSEVDMTQSCFKKRLLNLSLEERNIVFGLLYGLSFSVSLNSDDNAYENLSLYKSLWETQYRPLVLESINKLGLTLNQYLVLSIAENVFIEKNRVSVESIFRESIITLDKTVTDGKVWSNELSDKELSKVDYFSSWICDKYTFNTEYENKFPQMSDTFKLLKDSKSLKEQLINWELDGHSFLNSKFSNDLLTLIRMSIYDLSLAERSNEKIKLLNNPEGVKYFHYLATNIYLMTADMLTGRSYLMNLESKFKDIINVDQFWEKYIYLLFSECFLPEDKHINHKYLNLINLVGRMKWSKGEKIESSVDDFSIQTIISDTEKKRSLIVTESFTDDLSLENLSMDELLDRISIESINFDNQLLKFKDLQDIGFILERGVNKEVVKALENISPGCITSKVSLESFTDNFSYVNHDVAMEGLLDIVSSIFKMIIQNWKYIVPLIIAFFAIFKNPSKWGSSGGSGGGGGSSSGSSSSKMNDKEVSEIEPNSKSNPVYPEYKKLAIDWYNNKLITEFNTRLDENLVLLPHLYGLLKYGNDGIERNTSLDKIDEYATNIVNLIKNNLKTNHEDYLGRYKIFIEKVDSGGGNIANASNEMQNFLDILVTQFEDPKSNLLMINQKIRYVPGIFELIGFKGDYTKIYNSTLKTSNVTRTSSQYKFWEIAFKQNNMVADPIKFGVFTNDKNIIDNDLNLNVNKILNFDVNQIKWETTTLKGIDNINKELKEFTNKLEQCIKDTEIFTKRLSSTGKDAQIIEAQLDNINGQTGKLFTNKSNWTLEWPPNSGNVVAGLTLLNSIINVFSKLSYDPTITLLKQLNDIKDLLMRLHKLSTLKKNYYYILKTGKVPGSEFAERQINLKNTKSFDELQADADKAKDNFYKTYDRLNKG